MAELPVRDEPDDPEAAIRSANEALLARTQDALSLPIAILIEQRDQALKQTEALREAGRREREALIAEQDHFITFLMSDQEKKLVQLLEELKSTRERLERQGALEAKHFVSASPGETRSESASDLAEAKREIEKLQQLLESAYSEVDETRGDAARLQGEADEAVRSLDDVRQELYAQVEAARDEAFAVQSRLDATNRLLEDARDQARDEAFRAIEDLDELRRELDERNGEVRRLRQRLADLTQEARNSVPPPPPPAVELELSRSEVQNLRKQLIDSKRELSRTVRELELAGTRRLTRPGLSPGREPDSERRPAPDSERKSTLAGIGSTDASD